MSCKWVGLVEDKETNQKSVKGFFFLSFGSEDSAKKALEKALNGLFTVLEVSTNPYKYKELSQC